MLYLCLCRTTQHFTRIEQDIWLNAEGGVMQLSLREPSDHLVLVSGQRHLIRCRFGKVDAANMVMRWGNRSTRTCSPGQHLLWHGDFMEKVTLTGLDRAVYQLTLMDDYSRGYVCCDLFLDPGMGTTVRAPVASMRQWRVIPNAVLFDNGALFRGRLLVTFCRNMRIRLIHSAVNHPQTNGKLEGAFRDDMKNFYRQYDEWTLAPLRWGLPAYVHCRYYVRGHWALDGNPSIVRLTEHDRIASNELRDRLESFARYEVKLRANVWRS